MSHYSDPTANAAIGVVDREIRMMRKHAEKIKRRCKNGQLTSEELAVARKQFVGIYSRFLREALEDEMDR